MKKLFLKLTTLSLLIVLCFSAFGCQFFMFDNGTIENLPSSAEKLGNVIYATTEGERTEKTKIQLVEEVGASVVAIAMEDEEGNVSAGSGVIVDMNVEGANALDDDEVFIITCHHVVADMGTINVFLPDAEGDNYYESDYNKDDYAFSGIIGPKMYSQYPVTLVGGDSASDIAVLKLSLKGSNVEKENVAMAKFPDSTYELKVGEEVCAIGNPTGALPGTASFGYISYINRETSISGIGDMTLIQLNVDIYHGSSGGALFNMYGELVGITNAGNDEYSGLNFAIPFVIDSDDGVNDKGFLMVAGHLIGSATSKNYGYVSGRVTKFGFETLQQSTGSASVTVKAVTSGSIAYQAGLQANDIILKVKKNATSQADLESTSDVTSNAQVTSVFGSLTVGDTVSLLVERGTVFNRKTVMVTMTAMQYIFCDTGYYPTV